MTKAKDEVKSETPELTIADLKATTMVDIILELVMEHGYTSEEAKTFYKDNHEAIKAGTSFVAIFDAYLLEADRTEKDVIAFLSEVGRENKLKTKSHFISRAGFATTLRRV